MPVWLRRVALRRSTSIVAVTVPPGAIVPEVIRHNPDPILLVASNPVDVLTNAAWTHSNLPRGRVIGSGTILDTARLRALLGHHLALDPRNVNASTDLGISYYYTNQADRALTQFRRSLEVDPKHSKTLLNVGIVLAFGKQDLEGAAKAFQQVIDVAPGSVEARAARQALDGIRSAHPDVPGGATAKPPGTQG